MRENKKIKKNGNFQKILENLPLVISMKAINKDFLTDNKEGSKEINWGKFSSAYSLEGLQAGLKHTNDLEELGDWVHHYWVKGLKDLWNALERGYSVAGGYSEEKRESHRAMMIPYSELSREDQLKDIYTIKDLLTTEMWGLLDGYEYEEEFEKWDIGW